MTNYENNEVVRCLECGDPITYGRPDRKFCCDGCKNRFHNRTARNIRIAKGKVLNALEKNYTILSRLVRLEVTSLSVLDMKQLGFNFDYITSYHKIRRHDEFCCFDIRFTVVGSKVTSIKKIVRAPKVKDMESQNVSLHLPSDGMETDND